MQYKVDLKWLAVVFAQGKLNYEPLDYSIDYREYGAKVKEIIDEHLKATGLNCPDRTILKHVSHEAE